MSVVTSPEQFVELARGLPDNLSKRAQLFLRDVQPTRELVARFEEAGADDVTFVLTADRGADAVRRLADAVL
jgi:hypothetical protein